MGCVHGRVVALPQGPGIFARDGARAIQDVTNACIDPGLGRPTGSLSINVTTTGTIRSRAVDARMRVALASGVRVEVLHRQGARTVLSVSALDHKATLIVTDRRASRVVRETSFDAILERLVGLSVDPAALLRIVGGCYLLEPFGYVSEYGERWRRIPGGNGGNVYAHRDSLFARWRMAALYYPGRSLRPQWRLEYLAYQDGYARTLHLISEESHIDLTFRITNLDPRPSLPSTMFSIDVPPNAKEISLGGLDPL